MGFLTKLGVEVEPQRGSSYQPFLKHFFKTLDTSYFTIHNRPMLTKKDVKDIVTNIVKDAATQILDAVTRGFEVVATKDDLKRVENKLDKVESELKREINDLKADTPTPGEFRDHEKRINKLEQSVFPS